MVSAYVTVKCDGTFDEGRMPCRGTYSLPAGRHATTASGGDLTDLYGARIEAWEHGWTEDTLGNDYCPAHTKARRYAAMEESMRAAGHDIEAGRQFVDAWNHLVRRSSAWPAP